MKEMNAGVQLNACLEQTQDQQGHEWNERPGIHSRKYGTVDQEIFVLKLFRLKFLFCEIFMVSSNHENFLTSNQFCASKRETYKLACCIQGYDVYQHILSTAVGEVPSSEREPTNTNNPD